jgi:hypothetical protein
MTTVPGALTTPTAHDRPGTRSTTTTNKGDTTMTNTTDNVAAFLRHGAHDDAYPLARRLVAIAADPDADPRAVALVEELARIGAHLPAA